MSYIYSDTRAARKTREFSETCFSDSESCFLSTQLGANITGIAQSEDPVKTHSLGIAAGSGKSLGKEHKVLGLY